MWERCVFLFARYWIFFCDGHCKIVRWEDGYLFCIKWRQYFYHWRIFEWFQYKAKHRFFLRIWTHFRIIQVDWAIERPHSSFYFSELQFALPMRYSFVGFSKAKTSLSQIRSINSNRFKLAAAEQYHFHTGAKVGPRNDYRSGKAGLTDEYFISCCYYTAIIWERWRKFLSCNKIEQTVMKLNFAACIFNEMPACLILHATIPFASLYCGERLGKCFFWDDNREKSAHILNRMVWFWQTFMCG